MLWDHLNVTSVHTIYMIFGGYITLFSLCSLFIKEKLYIGEATVASVVGVIVGPHCLNWFNPIAWGNSDYITLELSRVVLIVQVFAVGVELPKKYMLRHWRSVFFLLVPVMTFGWVISGVIIWGLIPTLNFREGLAIGACITATDPVLASSVVGKGKFAKRVPGHLRNLLSAESACNDGMAFPFIYLSLALIEYLHEPGQLFLEWLVYTVLYECIFGCILGVAIGKIGRVMIKFCERRDLIDRESFLVFYFVLALFSCGVGVTLGTDDLLVAFCAGAAFAWDGWFSAKTEESHVSNVIDLIFNLAYFVYFGAIIPWDAFSNAEWGLTPWRLVVIAILVVLFRRIPAMLLCKPLIPDIRTWREALFSGHFGPIGVGALYVAILARGELEHGEPTPLAVLPSPGSTNYIIIEVIWPIVTFIVVCSILVHGSSIAVFTLGKRINTMTFTLSYTRDLPDGPSWLNRMPRLEIGQSISIRKDSEIAKPPPAQKRRMKLRFRRAGAADYDGTEKQTEDHAPSEETYEEQLNTTEQTWLDGNELITEDREGEIIREGRNPLSNETGKLQQTIPQNADTTKRADRRQKGNVFAYQIGDTVVWENEEGEVIKRYTIPKAERHHLPTHERMKVWFRGKTSEDIRNGDKHELESERKGHDMHSVDLPPELNLVDSSERVIPVTSKGSSNRKVRHEREEETAAERRRREAALGLRKNDSDSEDDEGVGRETAVSSSSASASEAPSGPSSSNGSLPALRNEQNPGVRRDSGLRPTAISFVDAPSMERGEREPRETTTYYRRHSPRPSLTWSDDVRKE